MKVRLLVKKENETKYKTMLKNAGFEISEESDLTFQENGYKLEYIIAKDIYVETVLVYLDDILLIETHGNELKVYTINESFILKGTIEYYQNLLSLYSFKRISQSAITIKRAISKISPAINMKFTLKLKNGKSVDVTRSYYYDFKEYIGL